MIHFHKVLQVFFQPLSVHGWTFAFLLDLYSLRGAIEGRLNHFLPCWLRKRVTSYICKRDVLAFPIRLAANCARILRLRFRPYEKDTEATLSTNVWSGRFDIVTTTTSLYLRSHTN